MKAMHANWLSVLLVAALTALPGCAGGAEKRAPEEWLSLSHSGLAAMDQYTFTGSISMGMDDSLMFKPQTFEGKVTSHEQLTIQSDRQDNLYWDPVELLEKLSESHKSVEFIERGKDEGTGAETLRLRVQEEEAAAKTRWETMLRQELERLHTEDMNEPGELLEQRSQLIKRSLGELEGMLATLKVNSHYDIVIDRHRMIPLKIDEQTTFQYERNGLASKESRHMAIRFQSFDGTAS